MNTGRNRWRRLGREVIFLAWPAMVQGLLTTVIFFTDRLLLGRYSADALGSMQVSGPIMWSIFSVFGAFGSGTIAVVGRAVGANEPLKSRDTIVAVCNLAFGMGIIVCVLGWLFRGAIAEILAGGGSSSADIRMLAEDYMGIVFLGAPLAFGAIGAISSLHACGDTKTPAWITAFCGVLNLGLSWVFIYGHLGAPELGVRGAAIGTSAAYIFHGILSIWGLVRSGGPVQGHWSRILFGSTLSPVLRVSWATFGERCIFHFAFLFFVGLIGRLGNVSMAANQSLIAIESLGFILASGFSIASGTLMAQKLGAGLAEDAAACGWIAAGLAFAVLSMVGALFWFLPEPLIKMISDDPQVLDLGVDCLKIAAIAQPLMGVTDALSGGLRGAGDTRNPMIVSFIGPLCIRLAACWILAFPMGYGLVGIWVGTTLDWAVRTVLIIYIFQKGRWRTIEV